jgi:L-threonylcarbamoyladenylate synthase
MPFVTVEQACSILKNGDVVAVPTETVYGLAGLIHDEAALQRIFATKQRPFFDPLIVHVANLESVRPLVAKLPPVLEALAQKFWPGPLTIVTEKTAQISDLITSGLSTVALRSPRHPQAQQILQAVGPFAAPSANRFGKTSPTTAAHVREEFSDKVAVVDGGACEVGVESTVVRLHEDVLQILRPGRILKSDLEPVAREFNLTVAFAPSEASPGHLPHHYQPEVPLVLLKEDWPEQMVRDRLENLLNRNDFVLIDLKLPREPSQAARILYSELRALSQNSAHVIVVQRANWSWSEDSTDLVDRLTRAASHIF